MTISSVSPGGNTLLRALASQSNVNGPGLSSLSGTMPIWLSTARACAFASGVCAVKLRPKTPATLVGERSTSMKPRAFRLSSRPYQQQLASWRARGRAELMSDGREEIDDLDRPVVAFRYVGRSLYHHGVVGEVGKPRAVDRVVVRGDHLAL